MYDEIEYEEYWRDSHKNYIRELAERLNVSTEEATLIMSKFLEKIHQEWVENYKNKYGDEKAQKYIDDLTGVKLGCKPIYILQNKYTEAISELEIDFLEEKKNKNVYTKKWENAKTDEERKKIEEESEQKINNLYKTMITEIINRKDEFTADLNEYRNNIENVRIENLKENNKNMFAKIWYIGISIITMIYLILKNEVDITDITGIAFFGIVAIIEIFIFNKVYSTRLLYIEKVFIIPLLVSILIF